MREREREISENPSFSLNFETGRRTTISTTSIPRERERKRAREREIEGRGRSFRSLFREDPVSREKDETWHRESEKRLGLGWEGGE